MLMDERGKEERCVITVAATSDAGSKFERLRGVNLEHSSFTRRLTSTHLLGLEVFVQQIQGLLVAAGASSDREHALPSIIVWSLCNGDARPGTPPDLADFAALSPDDATDHVGRYADVLSVYLFSILGMCRGWWSVSWVWRRSTRVGCIGKVCSTASAIEGSATAITRAVSQRCSPCLRPHHRVVKHSPIPALFVVNKALADLPDRLLQAVRRTCNFNDTLGGLRKHLLLGHHSHARAVLNLLDLQTLSSDNGAHLIVRDQKSNRWKGRALACQSQGEKSQTMRSPKRNCTSS